MSCTQSEHVNHSNSILFAKLNSETRSESDGEDIKDTYMSVWTMPDRTVGVADGLRHPSDSANIVSDKFNELSNKITELAELTCRLSESTLGENLF